jgi:hypothetical protein
MVANVCVNKKSVFNRPHEEWSITTYFGSLLDEAQQRFGPRLKQYTPIGIKLREGGPNQLLPLVGTDSWYVVLDSKVEYKMESALFFLAHEVIHLLAPTPKANCLEEGLATHFSLTHQHTNQAEADQNRKMLTNTDPLYVRALECYEAFLHQGGDIKIIRKHQPFISKITPNLIRYCAPNCDDGLITKLLGYIDDL